jgi:anaerobic selenocysteine-containing dehydrogenase
VTNVSYRTCPLCEASCGLEVTHDQQRVIRIRGDRADVFSGGYLCPKGSTLKQLHEDPDRLRGPMIRRNGGHELVSWPEAWQYVADRMDEVVNQHGRQSVAVYLGNPSAHSLSAMTFNRVLLQALGTRQRFSASTVDQMPKHVACGYLFGSPAAIPVPDLDRTDYLLVLGANPYASNGSLCTAPDFPGRLEAIQARGGRVVVVDPARTRTARQADEWVGICPGTDALLLAAMAHTMFREQRVAVGEHVGPLLEGLDRLERALAPFTPERAAGVCGVDPTTIVRLARELAAAPRAAVYGRMGTTTSGVNDQSFATVTSWLVEVLNILTGNLDREGGAMFPLPAAGGATTRGTPGTGAGFVVGRSRTRVSGYPEVMGEFPAAALAEEITTPGADRIRALLTIAGNPVLSTPSGDVLAAALDDLDFMVSVDLYLNETTRHADVILPPPSQLERSHYDLLLLQFAVRNVANYSPPVLQRHPDQPDEWEILARLALIALGGDPHGEISGIDDAAVESVIASSVRSAWSPVHGRDPQELLSQLTASGRRGPDRLLDAMLRTGPYGDGFGARPGGLTLDALLDNPHGIDLGPLSPRLPEVLRTPTGRIELAPDLFVADLDRLATIEAPGEGLVLIGRRHLRSNNSWMHNIDVLVKGADRCTLLMHPADAAARQLSPGERVCVTTDRAEVQVVVEFTEDISRGVVSLPHGWGHDQSGTHMAVAARRPGVNSNLLSPLGVLDPLSGTSVLNGIPVNVTAGQAH